MSLTSGRRAVAGAVFQSGVGMNPPLEGGNQEARSGKQRLPVEMWTWHTGIQQAGGARRQATVAGRVVGKAHPEVKAWPWLPYE